MSSLSWIDFDEAERQRIQRIMALFQEHESRDELGLGAIRDTIADLLFPGTSTIQTRLRYMLFVPWILRQVEDHDGPPSQLAAEARTMEVLVAGALKAGGETVGVIGRDAGARLQRFPSSVYWTGLSAWGIRLFAGSIDSYFSTIPTLRHRRLRTRDADERSTEWLGFNTWHPGLPAPPHHWLVSTTFTLTPDEAQFIRDRLVAEAPDALLTWLARQNDNARCNYIWEHPSLAEFPKQSRQLVAHAEMFSNVIHGASLLYNLQLAELRERPDWIETYRLLMDEWVSQRQFAALDVWDLEDFWAAVKPIGPPLRRFVQDWVELVRQDPGGLADSAGARRLVRERERRLKTNQSRFSNHAARDRWRGASGVEQLSFRWAQASSHLRDLVHGR